MPGDMGNRIRWMGEVLRNGAEREIREYQRRFAAASGLYRDVLSQLLISSFDPRTALEAAKEFFGSESVRFAAVDGTDYSKSLFDLVVFFGGAYAATGTLEFTTEGTQVNYDEDHLSEATGICSCVPIYISEVAEIDQALRGDEEGIAYNTMLTDEEIVTNSEIANRIMTFSEFYLAYKLAAGSGNDIRVIFLDRSLSGEVSSLMYDTSNRGQWSRACSLLGYVVDGLPIDENELHYSRHHLTSQGLTALPARGDYLIYAILHHLEGGRKSDPGEIYSALGLGSDSRRRRADARLRRLKSSGMVGDVLGNYRMASRYEGYWRRVRKMVLEIGERLFPDDGKDSGCMTIDIDGKEKYLTTMDLAFLTLFTVNMLIEECWSKGILLIGITKDTAARDLKRHVLPLLSNIGAFKRRLSSKDLDEIPNTDRMLLQATSMMNHQELDVPWALVEYDCAMRTIVHDPDLGADRVKGSIKNKIVPEQLMVKSYVQLAQAAKDPRLRSNVILIDRLVYPGLDATEARLMEFKQEYGGAMEPVKVILSKDGSDPSPLQNMVDCMLHAMTSSNIPELFGHVKPLFIADKVAKWNNECFRRMVETTAVWIRTNPEVRDFVFYMSSFRERRSTIEYTRSGG